MAPQFRSHRGSTKFYLHPFMCMGTYYKIFGDEDRWQGAACDALPFRLLLRLATQSLMVRAFPAAASCGSSSARRLRCKLFSFIDKDPGESVDVVGPAVPITSKFIPRKGASSIKTTLPAALYSIDPTLPANVADWCMRIEISADVPAGCHILTERHSLAVHCAGSVVVALFP